MPKIVLYIIVIVLLITLVSVAIYYGRKKSQEKASEDASNIMLKFPAKRGSKGEHIKVIQRWINKRLNPPLAQLDVDGDWGGLTDTALNYVSGKAIVTYPEYKSMVA